MHAREVRGFSRAQLILLTLLLLGAPSPASASCLSPPELGVAIAEADTVFVGVVVEVSNRQRDAVVEVEEVWKGDVDERVEVLGGPQGNNVISSVDAAYREDERYLFIPYEGSGDSFRDNACTSTQPYEDDLADLRPADAASPTTPLPSGTDDVLDEDAERDAAEPPARSRWIVPGILALLVAGALAVWLRSRPDEMDPTG